MKNTTFVSAGAGSGKTYRLTKDIAQMITDGKCQAEEIILTTYTEAAAKDLREKVRSTLYAQGLYDAAMNIDNAAIGTIHSIAYQFVSRYWYLLGISANVSIMDGEGSEHCISQSLSSLPTEEDLWLFEAICRSFNLTIPQTYKLDFGFWKRELKGIIDKTVELCIDESQLEQARDESKALIAETIGWNGYDITNEVFDDAKKHIRTIIPSIGDKKKKGALEKLLDELEKSNGDIGNLPVYHLYSAVKKVQELAEKTKSKFPYEVSYLDELLSNIPASNQVKDLIENYIDTVFRLAIKWKTEYEEFKRKRCLLDFGDLLQKFYELLNKDEVVEDIRSRYKVAFVDEFQDCSPLQAKFFVRLSELMDKSVWVGDIKQAIYGFRGTNTELVQSIIDSFPKKKGTIDENGNMLDSLKHCWRSNKTIVDLVNNVFCEKVFKGQLSKEFIELGMPDRTNSDKPAPREQDLRHMHFVLGKAENEPKALAEYVKRLISEGTYKPKDIAILYRKNSSKEITKCVAALKAEGIAYNARLDSNTDDTDSDTNPDDISTFIHAIVSFAARGDNELSKAIIANRAEAGCSITNLLNSRLQFIESDNKDKNWLDVDIVNRIEDIRKTIGNQSVSSAIETLIVELNIADIIKRIDPTAPAYNYCSALETKAATYEKMRANFGLSSTLVGFVDYLKSHPVEYPGDDNGVSVMTYHKSKGLEWPCVILCSLNNAPFDAKKAYFGVLTHNTAEDTQLRLIPSAMKGLSGITDKFKDNGFFKEIKRATINEAKRLMYVGMTRPKEQLILTTYGAQSGDNWLTSIGCDAIDSHADAKVINWGSSIWKHSVENYVAPDANDVVSEGKDFYVLKQPAERCSFNSKFVSPSQAKEKKSLYTIEQCATFAERISATAADGHDSTIGDFIHHIMCLWNGDKSIIERLVQTYGVKVDVEAVATSITNFWNWMEQTYGKPTATERELPFSFTNKLGQVVTGEIDLVYRTAEGDVLVDYKTYQGSIANLTDENSDFYAGKYAGQISLYEEALKRSGSIIRDRLICYLSLGVIIKMK